MAGSLSNDNTTSSEPGPKRSWRLLPLKLPLGLLLELLVVFVGVYAASALSERQKQREAAERRDQFSAALVREIEDITSNTRRVAAGLPPTLAQLDSLIDAGARPPLDPMYFEPVRVDTHMWEAILASGGLELFEVDMVYRLSGFYNELNAGFEQLAQFRDLSETVLIPNLSGGAPEFYDAQTGQLLPKYSWYTTGLTRLAGLAASITASGDSLVADLSRSPRVVVAQACQEECEAILTAAVEWSLARVAEIKRADSERVSLDTGGSFVPQSADPSTVHAEAPAVAAIGARLGIPAHDKQDDEEWRICSEAPASVACEPAQGKTFISVHGVELRSDEEAVVWSRTDIVLGGARLEPSNYSLVTELRLSRIHERWQVVDQGLVIVGS